MDTTRQAEEQRALWNGSAASAWIDGQALLDQMYQPFEDLLVDTVFAASGHRVLDVGCGTGSVALAVARRIDAQGASVGIDISGPMIAMARDRAQRERSRARFIAADAQTHAFEPAGFDTIISRFGVMFFADPVVAFSNLRRAVSGGGELHAIAWRDALENPFMTAAESAAAPLLPAMPPREPDAPGQFAFADEARIRRTLEASGWTGIDVRPLDVVCAFPETALTRYVTRLGPIGRVLQTADDATRKRVLDAVRPAFDPFVHGAEVRFNAACWMIDARASHV